MTPYESYQLYNALKLHFTSPSYDYFKYQGKTRSDHRAFEVRRDKYQFYKLSKHRDPQGLIVSNFIAGAGNWIGDLFTDEAGERYNGWLSRQQSITYRFQSDMERLEDDFKSHFRVKAGQHPSLLVFVKRGDISIETLAILNNLLTFFPVWDKKIEDPVLWPNIRDRCLKYSPFIKYDNTKIKKIVKDLI